MARVTVDDSLKNVKNRFELVLLASKRARDLMMSGIEAEVPAGNDKCTVVALREIAAGKIKADYLLRKSPVPKVIEPTYAAIDDTDFDIDDDSDNALIAALTTAKKGQIEEIDMEEESVDVDGSEEE